MRVMGIDCGSEYTGYGVVEEMPDRRLLCYAVGAIKLRSRDTMAAKLQQIFSELTHIIAEHRPEVVAIEDVFYAINVKSALKLGQVRGVAMLAASSSRPGSSRVFAALHQVSGGRLRPRGQAADAADGDATAEPSGSAATGRCRRCAGNRHLPHSYRHHAQAISTSETAGSHFMKFVCSVVGCAGAAFRRRGQPQGTTEPSGTHGDIRFIWEAATPQEYVITVKSDGPSTYLSRNPL